MGIIAATIVPNPNKPEARAIEGSIANFLRAHRIRIIWPSEAQSKLFSPGHIIITIGGDGTVLYNKNHFFQPFFAIGSSHSYICQARYDNWEEALLPIVKNGFSLDTRLMLSSESNGLILPDSLNEVLLTRRGLERVDIAEYELTIEGKTYHFRADGLMVATATGSSGWAYSYGAPELLPNQREILVVAMGAYRREFSNLLLPPGTAVKILAKARKMLEIAIDGQNLVQPGAECELVIKPAERDFRFIRETRN